MFTIDDDHRLDFALLQSGAVILFWRPEVLAETRDGLEKLGYDIAEVNCREGRAEFQKQFSDVLHWKEQFGYYPWGGNLDALNDGFREYPFGSSGRSALVLHGFNCVADEDSEYAHGVLDIIESASRDCLLLGKILICLVQTDDNRYECEHIGCRSAYWNPQEWMLAARGL